MKTYQEAIENLVPTLHQYNCPTGYTTSESIAMLKGELIGQCYAISFIFGVPFEKVNLDLMKAAE